jgi:predicted peptidase
VWAWAAVLAFLAAPLTAAAQDKEPAGKQEAKQFEKEITVKVKLNYLLYLPKDYGKGDKAWPLVLFLHGAGESGTDIEKVKVHGPPKLVAAGKEFPFILVSPQSPRFGWEPATLNALLDEVSAKYKVDPERVYVTGLSMGGMGTWALAAFRPERFAAIVPICGAGDPADAARLKDLPIRIYQGAKDPVIRLETAEAMDKALKAAGAKDAKLTVYPDAGHDSWTETYNDDKLYDWLLAQKRAAATKAPEPVTPGKAQKRTYDFKEAGKEMEYALFVPTKYDKDKKSPLVVALHGMGGNPQQFMRSRGLTEQADKRGYIVVAPMGYNATGGYGISFFGRRGGKPEAANVSELSEKDVMNVLALVRKEFKIDNDRIYLMGHSMGGGGTWHLGIKNPDLFAALGPIAPAIFRAPDDLEKIKHVPVILVQGDKDNLVPVSGARRWADQMKKLGMTYEYLEVEGGDHGNVVAMKMPDIFEFFDKHPKKAKEK